MRPPREERVSQLRLEIINYAEGMVSEEIRWHGSAPEYYRGAPSLGRGAIDPATGPAV